MSISRALKPILYIVYVIVYSVIISQMTSLLNLCSWPPGCGYSLVLFHSLWTILLLIHLAAQLFTRGRWALICMSEAHIAGEGLNVLGFALTGLLSSIMAFVPIEGNGLPHGPFGVQITPFGWTVLLSAELALMIQVVDRLTAEFRRLWLPARIRKAIANGKSRYNREAAMSHALMTFEMRIPKLIENAEERGFQSIELTFDPSDRFLPEIPGLGLTYDDMGWPTRRWGGGCHAKKFVHRARQTAHNCGLRTDVFLSPTTNGFCLQLSW